MPKFRVVIWKTQTDPSLPRYETEVTAPETFTAKRIAATREGCLESECTPFLINEPQSTSSSGGSSTVSGSGFKPDPNLIPNLINFVQIVLPYLKYLYIINAIGEEQEERKANLRDNERSLIKKRKFWVFGVIIFIFSLITVLPLIPLLIIHLGYFFGIRKFYVKTGNKLLLVSLVEKFNR
ncbi:MULTISPECIES: hypothetical protein [unclassified Prochlorococcus]|uniref:hypothetical protein n=1 Tax=unclassified Prochlorococcus TaxID=2627481 RepID=UPI000533B1AB|nr:MULTISPECIES: hypothetical protein [unclassified Prochlorococcus]KGG14839.1 hypothetical protein EV06_1902 [Prochlorococcus sp. MIT 0602]KGG15729.1 hypothetical protein EV07_1694 [Prochlorococcus sp. MIT 0603]